MPRRTTHTERKIGMILKLNDERKNTLQIGKIFNSSQTAVENVLLGENYGKQKQTVPKSKLFPQHKYHLHCTALQTGCGYKYVKNQLELSVSTHTIRNFLQISLTFSFKAPMKTFFFTKKTNLSKSELFEKQIAKPDLFWKSIVLSDKERFFLD